MQRYLSITDAAAVLGVSKQRVSALVSEGRIEPDAYIGNTPGFLPETIHGFERLPAGRPKAGV